MSALFKICCLVVLPALFPLVSLAQVKEQEPLHVWGGVEAEYQLSEKNTFYLDNQWRHISGETDDNLSETGIFARFRDVRFTLGYERMLNKNWSAEVAQRVSFRQNETKWYNRFMLNYTCTLGKTELESRVMYEHIRARDETPENEKLRPENRTRANLGLSRKFAIRKKQLELMAEGEVLFELNPETKTTPRVVDRTRLEVGITYPINETVEFTLFAIRQVRYSREFAEADNSQTESEETVKVNQIRPIFGFELGLSFP